MQRRAALLALLLGSEGCADDAVIIGSVSAGPAPLGVGLAGADASGVDLNKLVKDLSLDEAQAWCGWFTRVFPLAGSPMPEDRPVDPEGFVSGYGAIGCEMTGVCTEHLSQGHCVENLRHQPCEATLEELDACIGVLWGLCQLTERCAPFLAAPSCLGTIVAPRSDPDADASCRIRVK